MRVEITRNVMINGEPVKAGSFVEVEQSIATLLITGDKAKVAPKEEPKPELEIQQSSGIKSLCLDAGVKKNLPLKTDGHSFCWA